VATGLQDPVQIVSPDGDARNYLVLKPGEIFELADDGAALPYFDIRGLIRSGGERGLLSLAFHPQFAGNGLLYIHYTNNSSNTVIAELQIPPGGDEPDPESLRILFQVNQPASNHNGGMIQFGPDGYLYVALGDGGGANDRYGNGQRTSTILGTIVRIDVDSFGDEPFSVPANNPLVGVADADGRIWAYGLRNPWRFWIDAQSNSIYIGDVGQGQYEEVDVVDLDTAGYNFGWPITEGLHCFKASTCNESGLTSPVLEVNHSDAGTCSITGGVVYRGSAIPELDGHYFYSDFCGGYLRSFLMVDGEATEQKDWTDQVGHLDSVASFGVGADGEMYIISLAGDILRLVPLR
jgi:glucose/arabinose dehydrogenase